MSRSGQAAYRAEFEPMDLTPAERAFVNQPSGRAPMASDEVRMTIKLMDEQRLALLCDAIAELRRIQWQEDVNGRLFCASCERLFDEGHKPDCTLAAVLKRANDTP